MKTAMDTAVSNLIENNEIKNQIRRNQLTGCLPGARDPWSYIKRFYEILQ
jgi:hypothetical protein